MAKESGAIALNRVTNELEEPAGHKYDQRPAPTKKEQRPGNRNHRHPNHVTKLIDWVLMLRTIVVDEIFHNEPGCHQLRSQRESGWLIVRVVSLPDVDEDVHGTAAYHAFFAGFVGSQGEMVQPGSAVTHRLASLRPYFRFNTAATDRTGRLTIFEEQHLRTATLRR